MRLIQQGILAVVLSLIFGTALAHPEFLITHNDTDLESNALIAGIIRSPHPTPAHKKGQIYWNTVRIACFGHTTPGGICSAIVLLGSNTDHPIVLGEVHLQLNTGDITPKVLSNNGYTLTVNGPGETTLSKM